MNADQFNNPYAPTLGVEVRPEQISRHIAWFVSAAIVGFNVAVALHDGVSVFAMNMIAEPMIWVANAGAASVANSSVMSAAHLGFYWNLFWLLTLFPTRYNGGATINSKHLAPRR